MFVLDPKFTHLEAKREQILVLLHSLNAVAVKVPGYPTSPAMGYVIAWRVNANQNRALIYLHYVSERRAATYLYEPSNFPVNLLPEVAEEATEFLESMGFMLSDSAFGTLTHQAQEVLLATTPAIHRDLVKFAAARQADELPETELVEIVDSEPATAQGASANGGQASAAAAMRRQQLGQLLMSF